MEGAIHSSPSFYTEIIFVALNVYPGTQHLQGLLNSPQKFHPYLIIIESN